MISFVDVLRYLDESVGGEDVEVGAHDAFWRNKSRDEFVEHTPIYGVPLIILGDGSASGLVQSLRGDPPFGRDTGNPEERFKKMPSGLGSMSANQIIEISKWIDAGCPE